MLSHIVGWVVAAIVFLGLDAIWLSTMTNRLYRPLLGDSLSATPNAPSAVVFYALYISGLIYFAVAPALERGGLSKAALNAALLGIVAYGTYDLTNQATLKVWDVRITLADLGWGAFVTTVAGAAAYIAASRLR